MDLEQLMRSNRGVFSLKKIIFVYMFIAMGCDVPITFARDGLVCITAGMVF